MKKILSLIVVFAMLLSCVPSAFAAADYQVGFGAESVDVAPSATVDIPVYLVNNGGTSSVTGGFQTTIIIPEGLTFEVADGAIASSSYGVNGQEITILSETNKTFANDVALITVKVTAPATEGTYDITLGETLMYTTDYAEEITSIDLKAIKVNVANATSEEPNPGEGEEDDEPIVSDKDYMVNLGKKAYKADKGAVVEIPVYLVNNKDASSVTGGFQTEIVIPDGITFEVVDGAITSSSYGVNGQAITILSEVNKTFANDVALITIKVTAPAADGAYAITLGETLMYTTDYAEEITSIDLIGATINVGGTVEPPVEVNKYTVTYKVNGEVVKTFEDVEEGTATPAYEYTAAEGYTFSGWGEVPATVTEDLVIEGTTTVNKYTVTYKVNGEVVNTAEVAFGAEIPAYNYEVAEGYTFSGWDAEVPATMPAKDLVFNGETTKIIVKYTVTFKAEGAEDIVIEVEEGKAIGDALAADATKEGFEFAGWFDADDNEIDAETIVNGDIVATAKFQRIVGDVNCDGVKDSKDAIYLLNHCALPDLYPVDDYEYTLDMNGDGVVSSLDAIYLLNSIAIPALYSLAW